MSDAAKKPRGRPTPGQLREARRTFDRLRQLIRRARQGYELQHGVAIEPEPPAD